jgi:hypothetical protein
MEDRNTYLRKSRRRAAPLPSSGRRAWTLGRAGTMRRLAAALGRCVALGRRGRRPAAALGRCRRRPARSPPRWESTGEEESTPFAQWGRPEEEEESRSG